MRKCHKPSGLFVPSFGGWKSGIRVSAGLVPFGVSAGESVHAASLAAVWGSLAGASLQPLPVFTWHFLLRLCVCRLLLL